MTSSILLTVSLAALTALPGDELPIESWRERVGDLESLVAEFEITSKTGKVAKVHFAFAAPDVCHMRTELDGEPSMEVWLNGGETTIHTAQPDGSMIYGELDWLEIGEAPFAWLDELQLALPSGKPQEERDPGPIFDLWPDLDDDKIDVSLSYHTNRASLFGFLNRLDGGGFDAQQLEDGWEVDLDGEGRLRLEPELGLPSVCWLGERDSERSALTLTRLVIDGELDSDDLAPGGRPEGADDRSNELSRSFEQSLWAEARRTGYRWLAARADDGADLEEESREVAVEALGALHAGWAAAPLEARVESESGVYDQWLDKVLEWYETNKEDPEAKTKLGEALRGGREGVRQRLTKTATSYLERFAAAPLEDLDPGTAELLLELEAEGIQRAFEAGLIVPVMEHVDERLAELDH